MRELSRSRSRRLRKVGAAQKPAAAALRESSATGVQHLRRARTLSPAGTDVCATGSGGERDEGRRRRLLPRISTDGCACVVLRFVFGDAQVGRRQGSATGLGTTVLHGRRADEVYAACHG